MALVVLHRLLSHQIPEQHAEYCVRSQTQKDRTHAFVQAQHAFSLAHLQHTVWKPVVQTALEERKGCFFNCLHSVSAQPSVLFMPRSRDLIWRRQKKNNDPVRFIHWLVVQTRTDDIKRCHGDGHGDSTDHGSHQSNEPAVWTEPLDRETHWPLRDHQIQLHCHCTSHREKATECRLRPTRSAYRGCRGLRYISKYVCVVQ